MTHLHIARYAHAACISRFLALTHAARRRLRQPISLSDSPREMERRDERGSLLWRQGGWGDTRKRLARCGVARRRGNSAFGSSDRRAFMRPARLITQRSRGEGRPYRVSLDLKSIWVSAWLRIFVSSRRHTYNARALQLIDRVTTKAFLVAACRSPGFSPRGCGCSSSERQVIRKGGLCGIGGADSQANKALFREPWPATTHEVQV